MTYEEFLKFVPAKCIYETLYEDTEGRPILVISMLDAYGMVNKAQRPWQGLTDEDVNKESAMIASQMKLAFHAGMYVAQNILKERNT